MKHITKAMIPLALSFSIVMAIPAAAVVGEYTPAKDGLLISTQDEAPLGNSNTFWGTLSVTDGIVMLTNGNPEMGTQEVMLHINPDTLILDAVAGTPIKLEDIGEGEMVYAYTDVAMTMSIPAQTNAQVIIANIPADFGVPAYHTITAVKALDDGIVEVTTDHDDVLLFDAEDSYLPYLTRQAMNIADLEVGRRILVWSGYEGNPMDGGVYSPYHVMFLPVLETQVEDDMTFDVATVMHGDMMMYSIREIAEELSYAVNWNGAERAIEITDSATARGEMMTNITITATAVTMGDDVESKALTTAVFFQDGMSYLSAEDAEAIFDIEI